MINNLTTMQIASIVHNSLSNGEGVREVIFFQGCSVHCPDCFNKHTWPFEGGLDMNVRDIINNLQSQQLCNKVTLSGGNPLEQKDLIYLLKELKCHDYDVWCYSGFDWDYILEHYKDELYYIDVIVDGQFYDNKKDYSCKYRGSNNQRIIDVKRSLLENKVVEMIFWN